MEVAYAYMDYGPLKRSRIVMEETLLGQCRLLRLGLCFRADTHSISIQCHVHHPPHQISIEWEILESLQEKISFLVNSLEQGWRGEAHLEGQIVDAAYAAEDAIDSYVADQVLGKFTCHNEEGSVCLYQDLEKINESMDSIKHKVMQIKERSRVKDPHLRSSMSAGFSSSSHHRKKKMVGFEDQKILLMEKLASQQFREVISIVGMGGIGKTTLARNVYDDAYVAHYFDIRVWVTVSQEYNIRDILKQVLLCIRQDMITDENFNEKSEHIIGELVYRSLFGKRYLVVMDDIWSIDVWDAIKKFLPNNNNQHRIVLTTRLLNVANRCSTYSLAVKFLNEDSSWNLLSQHVFAGECCPCELEKIGKKIAENCRGLPLTIITIGGLLSLSDMTREYWNRVAEDVRSTMHLNSDEHCLKVLYSSYDHLPVHLKPCLLYMAIFPEDHEIRVSELCRLWVAEGFLKPTREKSLEETAEGFLKDLVERNLILIRQWGSSGKIKSCYVHDLVRDLCLREAQRGKFFCIVRQQNSLNDPQGMSSHRRFAVHKTTLGKVHAYQIHRLLESTLRFLMCDAHLDLPLHSSKFLRVFNGIDKIPYISVENDNHHLGVMSHFVNLRYVASGIPFSLTANITLSICLPRNLQTLAVRTNGRSTVPSEFWKMQQLNHMKLDSIYLHTCPMDQDSDKDCVVLHNLQTLKNLENFRCSEEFVKRIPNIRKLRTCYSEESLRHGCGLYDLVHLKNLESLTCHHFIAYVPNRGATLRNLVLPRSLMKLTLHSCPIKWEDMTMIGSLPNLQVPRLQGLSFLGKSWNPIEGEFLCLKYLHIELVSDFEIWDANRTNFPCLEQLVLRTLPMLKEIPLDFGEIPTLRLIKVLFCSDTAVISAKNILEEQQSLGDTDLKVEVHIKWSQRELLSSLSCENFCIQKTWKFSDEQRKEKKTIPGRLFNLDVFKPPERFW